jgi:hypothetical protein
MSAIEFTWDSRDLAVWRGGGVERALTRALGLAGNQALRWMQKDSISAVRARKLLREQVVKDGLPLVFPGRKATIRAMAWVMKVSGEPMAISRYPHIQTKRGVSFRINTQGGTKRIKSAFTARMRSGHEGVFLRKGKGRLPIQELWTSRISDVMKDQGTIPAIEAKAYAKMQTVFAKGLERELKKLRRRGEA